MAIETAIVGVAGVFAGALLKDWLDRRRDRDRPRLAAAEDHHKRRVADTYEALMHLHEQLSRFSTATELAGLGAQQRHCEEARAARKAIDDRLQVSTPLLGETTSRQVGEAVRVGTVALMYAERAADATDGHWMHAAMTNASKHYDKARPIIEEAFAGLRVRLHELGGEAPPGGKATPPALHWASEPEVTQGPDEDELEEARVLKAIRMLDRGTGTDGGGEAGR